MSRSIKHFFNFRYTRHTKQFDGLVSEDNLKALGKYAANGKHCVISGKCVVCKEPAPAELRQGDTITLKDFGPLDGTYRIAGLFKGTLKLELVK